VLKINRVDNVSTHSLPPNQDFLFPLLASPALTNRTRMYLLVCLNLYSFRLLGNLSPLLTQIVPNFNKSVFFFLKKKRSSEELCTSTRPKRVLTGSQFEKKKPEEYPSCLCYYMGRLSWPSILTWAVWHELL